MAPFMNKSVGVSFVDLLLVNSMKLSTGFAIPMRHSSILNLLDVDVRKKNLIYSLIDEAFFLVFLAFAK